MIAGKVTNTKACNDDTIETIISNVGEIAFIGWRVKVQCEPARPVPWCETDARHHALRGIGKK